MAGFKWRGIIEGFYGKPWTLEERKDMFSFMGKHNMNIYIYAPKDDPYHRVKWAEPYPKKYLSELAELAKSALANNINLVFAISPGLSIDYCSDKHFCFLLEKCQQLQTLGVGSFGLFFDDIPQEQTKELAEFQADLANRLNKKLLTTDSGQLFFCPTLYHGNGENEYVQTLGESLVTNIAIMWTGQYICSPALIAEDTMKLSKILRRPVFCWDNYPVNDVMMCSELHIGPYINRDKDLAAHCQGIVANPMPLVESSKISLTTIAAYLDSPTNYNPEMAWKEALGEVAGENFPAFYRFAQGNTISPLERGEPKRMQGMLSDFWQSLNKAAFMEGFLELNSSFQEMIDDVAKIKSSSNIKLLKEIEPWLDEYKQWGEIGKSALELILNMFDLLIDNTSTQTTKDEKKVALNKLRTELKTELSQTIDFKTKTCGEVVRNFAQEAYRVVGSLM